MRKIKYSLLVLYALLFLLLTPAAVSAVSSETVNITVISHGGDWAAFNDAAETNPYNQSINFTYYCSWPIPANISLENQDVIFTNMLWGEVYDAIGDKLKQAHDNGTVLIDITSVGDLSMYDRHFDGYEPYDGPEEAYFDNMGILRPFMKENGRNFLIYLASNYTEKAKDWKYEDPKTFPVGLYHPDAPGDKYFKNTSLYLEWYGNASYGEHHVYAPEKPTIGIWFHKSDYKDGKNQVIDALVRDIESKDCNVIAGFKTFDNITEYYCDKNGTPLVQCVISLKSFGLNQGNYSQGIEELENLDVPVLKGIVTEMLDWGEEPNVADANRSIPGSQIVRKTVAPNRDGIFEYVVIGKEAYDENWNPVYEPMPAQVDWLVNRSINWAKLKPAFTLNEEKKVALIYYNYPSGKDNIGASYLNSISSMRNLLLRLDGEGYNVTYIPENESELLERIHAQGINAGSWAPGVLEEMVENRTDWGLQLIPMKTYREWFEKDIPENLQKSVLEEWGTPWAETLPENKSLMLWTDPATGEQYIVLPAVQCGNVWLMPQPARGFLQNNEVLYHSSLVPPPHQYIAFYLWLNNEWNPNAVIHLGTHGTQEWLPGSPYGLNRSTEWSPVLLQDLPNIYPYIVANVGEGLTAEYRGNALIIDHLTPTLERGGLYGQLSNLSRDVQDYYGPELKGNPELKKSYQKRIVDQIFELNLSVDLGLENASELYEYNESQFDDFVQEKLHEYLEEIQGENIPYGMHVLGEVPARNFTGFEGDEMAAMVRSMLGRDFKKNVTAAFYSDTGRYPLGIPSNDSRVDRLVWEVVTNNTLPKTAQDLVYGISDPGVTADLNRGMLYRERLLHSAGELDRVISALSGGYIPPGPGTDPVQNPASVPTGRNFWAIDENKFPSPAAWELGKKLAEELLDDYYTKHGKYPEKVSFSRFGVEFIRDHGTQEAEILYLLGVRPVWDSQSGHVKELELINESELRPNYNDSIPGRPRIDIVYATAGMRDAFPGKIQMIDRAVKLANQAPEENYPNYVNRSTEAIRNYLEELNYDSETAKKLSTMRCFAVREGTYEIGVSNAIGASGTWENEAEIAKLYLEKMGYAYGGELWGYKCSDLLIGNLKNVDASVHSDSSNLYDMLDNDDVFQYFGGLNLATRYVRDDHKTPDMYISDTRTAGAAEMVDMQEYLSRNLRSRYFNDKWIEGMQKSGYAGGRMMSEFVNNLFGWEVSNPDLVDDSVWEQVYDTYVNDPAMKEWFKQNSPDAYEAITARMLETVRHGYWKPSDEVLENLATKYAESVAEDGASCCHHTCGNPTLNEYVNGMVSVPGFNKQMDRATSKSEESIRKPPHSKSHSSSKKTDVEPQVVSSTASNQTTTADQNEAGYGTDSSDPAHKSPQSEAVPDYVEGYEMQKEPVSRPDESGGMSFSGADIMGTLFVVSALGAIFLGFRKKKL